MATVLVTGSSGRVGSHVVAALAASGTSIREFDLQVGDDLRDAAAVLEAVEGVEAVVHTGAIPHDSMGTPAEIMATNVLGTWHVLIAAEQSAVERVIYFSSAQVFGLADGEGEPVYLPVNDAHPLRAARPYGLSKRLTEEMCQAWSTRTGIPTLVLRPVMILDDDELLRVTKDDSDVGAFVHVDDVVAAVAAALRVRLPLHARLTLCGPGAFDTTDAERVLGWQAQRGWS